MTRILLSTATTPYPVQPWHDTPTDLSRQRLAKGQGIFTNEGHAHLFGVFLLAQNLSVPVAVLDHPTMENWVSEIKKGYDYIGISSLTPNMESVLEMLRQVRIHAPDTKTVVGGFVAEAIKASFSEEDYSKLIDDLVLVDGVRWLRELVGDDIHAPVRQHFLPRATTGVPRWIDKHPRGVLAPLVSALGCSRGCNFCYTTVHFGGKRHQLATAEQLRDEIKLWQNRAPGTKFVLYEEDQDREAIDELGRVLRADPEIDFSMFSLNILVSINTLSTYEDMDELAHNGVGGMFVGLESKFAQDHGYRKAVGEAKEVFDEVHRRGMRSTIGWMVGFDWHTRDVLEEDFQYLVSCQPVSAQLTRVTPYPGTPLYNKLKREDRIGPHRWEDVSFYGGGMIHEHLSEHEIMEFIRTGDERLAHTLGPSALRAIKVHFNGFERYKEYDDVHFQQIAEGHRKVLYNSYVQFAALDRYAPNGMIRKMIKELEQRWRYHFGNPPTAHKVRSKYTEIKATYATLKEKVFPLNRRIHVPPATRYQFLGSEIKDDGSLPYTKEYLNEDPNYLADMAVQNAERAVLDVALKAGEVLDDPETKLHDVVKEVRSGSAALFNDLAGQLRQEKLDTRKFLSSLQGGVSALATKVVEAGENPANGVDEEVRVAKNKLADMLEFYAKVVGGTLGLKKIATHPDLSGMVRNTIEGVKKAVKKTVGAA